MARRLEPPVPGSDVGSRGRGAVANPARAIPALDLTAPAIIGVAPETRAAATVAATHRPFAAPQGETHQRESQQREFQQRETQQWGSRQRETREVVEFDEVPEANSLADVRLLNRVRDRLIELPEPVPPAPEQRPAEPPIAQPPPAEPSIAQRPHARPPHAQPPYGQRPGTPAPAEGELDLTAIRETFALVGAGGDEAAAYFYGWLFTERPELRDLFPIAMDEQRDRLFAALTTIVGSLRAPAEMTSYLAQLGRDHRKFSVTPAMYPAVGSALIATLRAYAGAVFTPAAEQLWLRIYQSASEVMIAAAREAQASAPARWTAQVVGHERRSRAVAIVTVAPDQPLPYQAGQHITMQTSRWPRVWRPFSVAGRPRSDGLLVFHVKAIPGGWVSNALVKHTAVGDQVILGPAAGQMSLGRAGSRDLVCVAGGTGLAPLKAIAEQVVFEESQATTHRNVALFWGARDEGELYDLNDLWQLSDAYPWLQIYPVTSQDESYPGMRGNVGQLAARYLPHTDCEAYVSGPAGMVKEAIDLLAQAGVPSARIHYDDGLLFPHRRAGSGGLA